MEIIYITEIFKYVTRTATLCCVKLTTMNRISYSKMLCGDFNMAKLVQHKIVCVTLVGICSLSVGNVVGLHNHVDIFCFRFM